VLSMCKPKPTGVHLDCPARTVQAKAPPRLSCTSANSRKLVKGIRRAIARRLVDAGNMSPRGVRGRLRHQLVRLRIAERPGVRRARQRMRMPRQIPRQRPSIALRRAVAIDEARAARERVVDGNRGAPTSKTCAQQARRMRSSGYRRATAHAPRCHGGAQHAETMTHAARNG
jgi:hypothetical protein